jgi:hypothetical protein
MLFTKTFKKPQNKSTQLNIFFFLISLPLIIVFSKPSSAYQPIYNEVARNTMITGKVVRLNLPVEGITFRIHWITEDNKRFAITHFARKGTHIYEMRNHRAWRGKAKLVSVTKIRILSGELITPVWKDEIDMFLSPEQWVASTINGFYGHTLFGVSWNIILLILMLCFTIILFFFKFKKFAIIFLLSFVFTWGIMDIRTMFDHVAIISGINENQSMLMIKHLRTKSDTFADIIAQQKWTHNVSTWPHTSVIKYSLAEHKYVPSEAEADFVVQQQKNGQLVLTNTSEK